MKAIEELKAALESVRGGAWSWEDNGGGSWTLYSESDAHGKPPSPGSGVERVYSILTTAPDGFDAGGAELRAFIVAAHERLPNVLADVEAERKAWARHAAACEEAMHEGIREGYNVSKEGALARAKVQCAKQALRNIGVDVEALMIEALTADT